MCSTNFTSYRFKLFRWWLFTVFVTATASLVAQDFPKLEQLVQTLESANPLQRLQARIDLKDYLENSDDLIRAEL